MIGNKLAHYEILSELGKGGMGEVYRARDTKLGREVAIKLLPNEFSEDPERVARFEREARTLASLQHANIAAIYGFEQDQGHRFLAMELVEGEDLSQRLSRGAIPLRDSLNYAVQIAEALDAAHERGIVHRDLKPANVMLTKDGSVKILDFGLARAYLPEEMTEAELANSPTITAAMTQAGTILGTAAYMSPEQARGNFVDRRADIWALGVILFEMLTGKRLFDGPTVSDTLAAVLRADPDWDALPKETSHALRRFLRRCLRRDARERLRDAGDAALELREIQQSKPEEQAVPARKSRRVGGLAWLLVAVLSAALLWRWSQSPTADDPMVEFAINPPVEQAMREFTLAPDGTRLVVVSVRLDGYRSLWLREFDDADLRELPGTEGVTFPFWSPDSRSIAFFSKEKLRRMDLANENIQTIADAPNGRGGAWSIDDFILFTPEGEDVLYRIPSRGGTPEPVTSFLGNENTHRFPHFAPGSTNFTFCAQGNASQQLRRYYRSLDGKLQVTLPEGFSESYPTQEHLLYVREGDLVAQRFDVSTGALSGEAQFLAGSVSDVFPRNGRSAYSVSHNGVLAYLQEPAMESVFTWLDGSGLVLETSRGSDRYEFARPSRDLERMAFARVTGVSNSGEIWIHDLARGSSRRLAGNITIVGSIGWGHDDRSILFARGGILYRQGLDEREPEVILDPSATQNDASLSDFSSPRESSDGSFIVFSSWDSNTDFDLWRLDADQTEPERLIDSPNLQGVLDISPNDRWLAYVSQESGRADIYVCATTSPTSGRQVSTDGGFSPLWSDDGSRLYYVAPNNNLMEADIIEADGSIRFSLPRVRFQAPLGPGSRTIDDFFSRPNLLAVRDGKFLFNTPSEAIPPRVIKVVLNWQARLEE